ncbi:MAG: hypothetical protein ABI175_03125 [Polyangiales bacterium]
MRSRAAPVSSVVLALTLALLVVAPRAAAQATAPASEPTTGRGRFEVDARLGYAVGNGYLTGNAELSDSVSHQVPITIGAGHRSAKGTYVGAYFGYGVLATKEGSAACPSGWNTCRGHAIRFGLEMLFHLRPHRSVDPWVGFGIGYEWLTHHASLPQSRGDLTDTFDYEGSEILNLQSGVDFEVSPAIAIGPFVTLTVASFREVAVERTGTVTVPRATTTLTAWHEWAILGVRGTFGLF